MNHNVERLGWFLGQMEAAGLETGGCRQGKKGLSGVKRSQNRLEESGQTAAEPFDQKCPLTLKQLHLLSVAVWFGTNTEALATKLGTSKHTINNHFSHINRVLNCTSRADSVLISLRKGWISISGEPLLYEARSRSESDSESLPDEIK